MRRVLLASGVLGLLGVVVLAQPPAIPPIPQPGAPAPAAPTVPAEPPRTLPVAVAPAATASTGPTLRQFEPFAAFPDQTQNAIRSVLLAAEWMTRKNQPNGRFQFGYNPALRQSIPGDHDLKQARAALALAQTARFTGDPKQTAIASQCILTLLASTRIDPSDPNCRVPVQSSLVCNRVGFAATVALAVYELPAPDAKLVAEAERLCEFLHKQCRTDGSVHYTDGTTDVSAQVDPQGMNEYPGLALHAIMAGNRVQPAAWKTETAKKGMEHYRAAFRAKPHPMLAATLTPACAELYLQTKSADAAGAVFEMNDWLCGLQIPPTDPRTPQWAGGFRNAIDGQLSGVADIETGQYLQSLAFACQLTRFTTDLDRNGKYKAALTNAVQFLTGMQYTEANTRHFENTFRVNVLIGGFYLSPADGNLRIDATGTAMTGLLKFLGSGAEK